MSFSCLGGQGGQELKQKLINNVLLAGTGRGWPELAYIFYTRTMPMCYYENWQIKGETKNYLTFIVNKTQSMFPKINLMKNRNDYN